MQENKEPYGKLMIIWT